MPTQTPMGTNRNRGIQMLKTIFEWTTILTWVLIITATMAYGGLWAMGVIYSPVSSTIHKDQSRFPHRVAYVLP